MTDPAALKRILIFDDDIDFRKLLLLRLKKMFAGVDLEEYDPIASGVPGEDFNWSGYDVLLLDYYLCIHGVTGLDILHKNRKNPNFPATIMLTGAGNEEIAVHALKSGVSDYIRKEKLDKDELRESILNAFEEQKDKRKKVNEATLHGQAFNKAGFYEQLKKPNRDSKKRILLIMQLDAHEQIATRVGIIVRDNVVRHLAKQSFEVFQVGECNPNITRYNEFSIALLIDDPDSQKTLDFNLQGLCKHLQKRPYKFDGKKYRFSVSIGVVAISEVYDSAATMTNMGSLAADAASSTKGENSYRFYNDLPSAPTPAPTAIEAKEVAKEIVEETQASPEAQISKTEASAATAEIESAPKAKEIVDTVIEVPAQAPKPQIDEVAATVKQTETADSKPAPTPAPALASNPEAAPAAAPAAIVEKKAPVPAPKENNVVAKATEKVAPAKPAETITSPAPASKPEAAPAVAPTAIVKKKVPAPAPKENNVVAKATEKVAPPKPAETITSPAPASKPEATPAVAPAAIVEKKAPVPESDESILDGAAINIAALAVKRAFEEKRVIQIFQPMISFLAEESEEEYEVYNTSLQLFEHEGEQVSVDEILSRVGDVAAFLKYIDRWMLREAIGRAVNSSQNQFVFVMKISDASLADATLFNWLRQLLSGLEKSNPGRAITLEISSESFASHQKPAQALMTYLRKSHRFRFMLAHVDEIEQLKTLTEKTDFDFIKISPDFVKQLAEQANDDSEEGGTLLSSLKNRGFKIVVKDVEDATTLTQIISLGADFAMGEFIGEATTQLDDSTNVESFDIS
jgi:EAL domain-containing protein (putative c-di-GMP-specific phosphodiesterase class I)/FixJ family two-component response regulator